MFACAMFFFLETKLGISFIMRKMTASIPPLERNGDVDWSQYAYCQYATNVDYLYNSVMIFESLDRLGANASKILMYPQEWNVSAHDDKARLLRKARDSYNVNLSPINVQHLENGTSWDDSFTKLLAFNQTQYKRVLSLDSDTTVIDVMDELFLIPTAPVAMPRAYWLEETLSSLLILIEPSEFEFRRIVDAFSRRSRKDFDMEIVNELYGDDWIVIPHRRYALLTGEFRAREHHRYLGSKEEIWDPKQVIDEAKFIHFSDWPLPKPWLTYDEGKVQEMQPECQDVDHHHDCRDREIWLGLYRSFKERRQASTVLSSVYAASPDTADSAL